MNNKNIRLFKPWLLLLIGLVIFLSPLFVRMFIGNPLLFGEETYFHLNQIQEATMSFYELLISFFQGTFFPYVILLQLALVLISVYLLYLLLEPISSSQRTLTLLLFIFSPLTIYLATTITPYALALMLGLGFLLAQQKEKPWIMAAIALLLPLIDVASAILVFFTALFLSIKEKRYEKVRGSIFLLGILMIVYLLSIGTELLLFTETGSSPSNYISEFGALQGYAVVFLFLGIIGMIRFWNRRDFTYLLVVLVIILSLYSLPTRIFGVVILAYYASKTVEMLLQRKWKLHYIRFFTFLLLFCTLLFSTLTQIRLEGSSAPTQEDVLALGFLGNQALDGENVFTHPSNQEYVKYYSGLTALPPEEDAATQQLLASYSFEQTAPLLETQGIKYFFLNLPTKNLWHLEQAGLTFLLTNSDRFIRIYQLNDLEIYMYLGQEEQ